jgi:E-phenylitaconyl-CoA hydratase
MSIDVTRAGRIAIITLNRPEASNALNPEDAGILQQALLDFDADRDLTVAIVTGAGPKAFCAGADLSRAVESEATAAETALARADRSLVRDPGIAKPLIAAINGHALGGGLELALICDIRVAATNATFGLPEVAVGSLPGSGGTQRLQRVVAPGAALHLCLTGERIDAAEAYRIGLVTRLVPPEQLMQAALVIARKIDGNAPLSVRAVKQAVRQGQDMPLAQALLHERMLFNLLRASADRIEGRRAFREKRPPKFEGR